MKRYWIGFVAILVLLSSCGSASSADYAMEESMVMSAPAAAPMEMEFYDESVAGDSARSNNSVGVEPAQQERLVIMNADLSITVDDPNITIGEISALAEALGGHVISSNIYQTYASSGLRVPEGEVTIRVPSESLNDALKEIKESALEVDKENVSGQDVTDQYVDLQSRLKAKKAAEAKLLEIMEQADSTEDTLNVYAQLQVIQSEIEVLTGQINYYERSAAMSSITVRIVASEKNKPIEIGGWELGETASESVQDLIDYLQGFAQFIIRFVILILPVLITLALPFYLVFLGIRALLRRRRAKKAAKAEIDKAA